MQSNSARNHRLSEKIILKYIAPQGSQAMGFFSFHCSQGDGLIHPTIFSDSQLTRLLRFLVPPRFPFLGYDTGEAIESSWATF